MKAFLIGYPIAVFLAALGAVAAQFDYSKTDWPAWVQAVGSVLAIFVAIAIAGWQGRKQQLDRRRQIKEDADSITLQFHLICIALVNSLSHLRARVKQATPAQLGEAEFTELTEISAMLRELPIAKLDRWTLARMFTIRGIISKVRTRFGKKFPGYQPVFWEEDMQWIDEQSQSIHEVIHASAKTLHLRGIEQPNAIG